MHTGNRQILLASDVDEFPATVIETAVGLSKSLGAPLHVARVVAPSSSKQRQADVQAYLDGLRPKLEGLVVQFHALIGSYQQVISQLAREEKCRLVVMFSHQRFGPYRHMMGSTAESVLRTTDSAVLMLRPVSPPAPTGEFKNVLVPVTSARCCDVLGPLTPYLAARARVSLLHCTGPQGVQAYRDQLEEQLRAPAIRSLELEYHSIYAEEFDFVDHVAEEHHCDLIALPTHSRRSLKNLFIPGTVLAFPSPVPPEVGP